VDWKKVTVKRPMIRFKKMENTNYAVVLGKSFKYSLVAVQGADITDGVKTLTLGLVVRSFPRMH
jgi:plastin-1